MEDQESPPYINTIFCNLIMSCEIKYAKRHRNEIEKDWWKRKKKEGIVYLFDLNCIFKNQFFNAEFKNMFLIQFWFL